jgi:hypothetical protein
MVKFIIRFFQSKGDCKMTIKRMKNTAVLLSLTSVLIILTGCNSKQGIESSKLGEKVAEQTKVLGAEDAQKEEVESLKKESIIEDKSQNVVKSEEFKKQQLQEATQHMNESFDIKTQIKGEVSTTLTKAEISSLKLSNEKLSKYNSELELQFAKYPNLTQEDYNSSLKIIDSMINEINNMNKIQNNSDEFKGLLVNTIEGLVTTKNYITQSRNHDLTSQQAVLVPELLKKCIDIYNDNMGGILLSINDYVYSK